MKRPAGRRRRNRTLRKVRNTLVFWLARVVLPFFAAIPLRWGLCICAVGARVAFAVLRLERKKTLTHLRVAFPDKSDAWRVDIGRRVFVNLASMFVEVLHFSEILDGLDGEGEYAEYVKVEGEEHLKEQMAGGRGALMITGHCGSWELMAAVVSRLGYPVSVLARRLYDPRFDKMVNDHRRRFGYHPIMREGYTAAAAVIRVLRKNEVVGVLMDQDTKVRSVFVPFFGHMARTPSGPAYLAYHANMNALAVFIHRRPEGGHTLVIGPPVPRPQTGDPEADIVEYTTTLTQVIEDYIRRHPDEWVWMHRRWKRRPEGEPPEKNPVPELR